MKRFLLSVFAFIVFPALSQQPDSVVVNYYEHYPFAFSEGGKLKGIEIDILNEYVAWLKQKKNMNTAVAFRPYRDFAQFYNSVKSGHSWCIGLGSVTRTGDREKDIQFSAPYLQNLAVMATAGTLPTVRSKEQQDVMNVFSGLTAMAVEGSSHVKYLNEFKSKYGVPTKITTVQKQEVILEAIGSSPSVFGYVDIIAYWAFVKAHPDKFIKMQKMFSEPKEFLGFALPKKSVHASLLNEFFESGFGFTSTKVYRQILEKYLGHEIIDAVEIK